MREGSAKRIRQQLGYTLRAYRIEMGISQEKLAEFADVHRNYIGKIERGEQNITINNLYRLSKVFQCSLSEIFADAKL